MKNTTKLTPLKAAYAQKGRKMMHRRQHNNYSSCNDYLDHYAKNKPSMWKERPMIINDRYDDKVNAKLHK